MEKKGNPKRRKNKKASEIKEFIPDYDHLFQEEQTKEGKIKDKFFQNLIKINIWPLIYSTLVYILQALPTWVMPLITANIINIATDALSSGSGITMEVWTKIIINCVILIVSILQNIPTTIWRWNIVSKMLRNTSAGIKISVVRKLQTLSLTYHKDMRTGKIQSKFLKDTETIDGLFSNLMFSLVPNLIGVIVSSIIAIVKNIYVSLFFVLIIPCNILVTRAFRTKIRNQFHDYRIKTEDMSSKLTTMLEMLPVTKAHGLENKEISNIESSISELKGSGLNMDKISAKFGASSWVVSVTLSSICLIFCTILALFKVISIGDVVLFQSMFSSISAYVSGLVGIMPQIHSGKEAMSSVSELMNSKDVEINIGKTAVQNIDGKIDFENVSYKYPKCNQFVIKDFSMHVKKGECIAVVGSSGSGKSTIMNLIIGFLIPTSGTIKIDDKDLTECNLTEYRHNISVVPQNSILFAGTIRENITYGLPHYSEEELQKVIDMANVTEFLKDLPNGIDTNIGEHGEKLSGGQKQRITIARALIRNPKILILDEATSALDNISEYHVQKAIESSIKGRTTFIVAHRLSTIRNADRIIVMEQGKCVESGTYEELVQKKGKFFELKTLNEINLKQAENALS